VNRSAERAARNEAAFRDVNEQIEDKRRELAISDGRTPFLCECEEESCTTILRLSPAEYQAVRADPAHFALAIGHDFTQGRIVSQNDRYAVVEKVGTAGRVAAETDPRS
jgi:hypothetical protein